MYESMNKKYLTTENVFICAAALLCLGMVILMDRIGMPQKWHAAVGGTGGPFVIVLLAYRRKWRYWTFWAALGICFAAHLVAIWVVFERVLAPVKVMGILIWGPIAFAEGIFLLGMIPILERRLRGEKKRGPGRPGSTQSMIK